MNFQSCEKYSKSSQIKLQHDVHVCPLEKGVLMS